MNPGTPGKPPLDKQAMIDELMSRMLRNVCAQVGGCTRRCRRSGRCVKADRLRDAHKHRPPQAAPGPVPPSERQLSTRSERHARLRGLFKGPPQRRKRRQPPPVPAEGELS